MNQTAIYVWQRLFSCPASHNCLVPRAWNEGKNFLKLCGFMLSITDVCTSLGMKQTANYVWQRLFSCTALHNCFLSRAWNHSKTSWNCVILCPALHIFVHPWAWIKQQNMYDNACFQVQHYKIVQFLEHEMTAKFPEIVWFHAQHYRSLYALEHETTISSAWKHIFSCPALQNCLRSRAWNHSKTFLQFLVFILKSNLNDNA